MGNPFDPAQRSAALRRAGDAGTWRFRSNLSKVAVAIGVLGIAAAVSATAAGFWPGYGAALCWWTLGALAWRLHRRLADGTELPAARRGVLALYGLGLFLLGTAFIAVGAPMLR